MLLLFVHAALASPCVEPTTASDLQGAIVTAEVAFADMDDTRFAEEISRARSVLECVDEPLEPILVGSVHRVEALAAFLERDHDRTIAHFRALLDVEPGYALSETLAPVGHPLRDDFEHAGGFDAGAPTSLPITKGTTYRVDGEVTFELPSDRPCIVQTFDASGEVVGTRIVSAGAAWNATPALEPSTQTTSTSSPERSHGARLPLLVTAGLSGVVAGTFYAIATQREAEFWDPETPNDELTGLRRQTNTYAYLALGLGGVAVGTGAAAVFTGTF